MSLLGLLTKSQPKGFHDYRDKIKNTIRAKFRLSEHQAEMAVRHQAHFIVQSFKMKINRGFVVRVVARREGLQP